jgi:hypothetical protein
MKKIVLILITFLFITGCNSDDDYNNLSIKTLPIKEASVPDEFILGDTYQITIKYDLPNDCYSFRNLYYQYENSSRIIAVNTFLTEDIACTGILIEEEYTFDVLATQSEDYIFKFWKGKDTNDEDIFEEIIVPVN